MGSAADRASVAAEGDGLGLLLDVLEELEGALQLPSVDGLGGLAGVLEGDTEVGTAGAGRFGGNDLSGSVPNLFVDKAEAVSLCPPWSFLKLVVVVPIFIDVFIPRSPPLEDGHQIAIVRGRIRKPQE